MNRNSFIITTLLLLQSICCFAQPKPGVQGKVAIKDSFALNILSTIDKVLKFTQDKNQPGSAMAGELLSTEESGAGVYQATVVLPGSIESILKQSYVWRHGQLVTWKWEALLVKEPKGTADQLITAKKNKVDSLLTNFSNRNLGSTTISTYSNLDINYRDEDKFSLLVSFNRPTHNTEQQALDSLVQLYKPLLFDINTVQVSSERFAAAIYLENIDRDLVKSLYFRILPEIANRNITAGYITMIEAPTYIDLKELNGTLTYSQQEQVREMARKQVEQFYKEQEERINGKKPDPIVAKQKEIEKEKPPTDPCAREKWELRIKPGAYVIVNGQVTYVVEFSCESNLYKVAWVDQGRKLLFNENVTVAAMNNYQQTSASPFSLCFNCNGIGHFLENEWYQMGTGSNFYARSDKQRKVTCGVCHGSGFTKIR